MLRILLVLTVVLAITAVARGDVLFQDDFERAEVGGDWSTPYGLWSIVDEGGAHGRVLRGEGQDSIPYYHSGMGYVTAGTSWTNCSFEYDIKGDEWDLHGMWRFQDGVPDYYKLDMMPYSHTTQLDNGLDGDPDFWFHNREDTPWSPDVWYHVKATVEGSHVTVEVDGTTIWDVTDGPITHPGTVGFVIWPYWWNQGGGRVLYYDNVVVVPEPATLSLIVLGALLVTRRRR